MDWYTIKLLVAEQTDISRDALHIFLGIAGQLLVAFIIRRSLAHPLPWFSVLIGEAANEYYDLSYEDWLDRPMWPGSVRDLLVTMAIPTLLFLLARFAPWMLVSARGKRT